MPTPKKIILNQNNGVEVPNQKPRLIQPLISLMKFGILDFGAIVLTSLITDNIKGDKYNEQKPEIDMWHWHRKWNLMHMVKKTSYILKPTVYREAYGVSLSHLDHATFPPLLTEYPLCVPPPTHNPEMKTLISKYTKV